MCRQRSPFWLRRFARVRKTLRMLPEGQNRLPRLLSGPQVFCPRCFRVWFGGCISGWASSYKVQDVVRHTSNTVSGEGFFQSLFRWSWSVVDPVSKYFAFYLRIRFRCLNMMLASVAEPEDPHYFDAAWSRIFITATAAFWNVPKIHKFLNKKTKIHKFLNKKKFKLSSKPQFNIYGVCTNILLVYILMSLKFII
jgi:hypothetical protein